MAGIINNPNISNLIESKLKNLPDKFVISVATSVEKYSTVDMALLEYLVMKNKAVGIYVTMNKPYETLVNMLSKSNVDIRRLFFVDTISNVIGRAHNNANNCVTIQSPSALTQLGIVITKACSSRKMGFLVLDSLSTMLVYNDSKAIVKFSHFLINQLRKYNLTGVILSLNKEADGQMFDSVTQFCDDIVRF